MPVRIPVESFCNAASLLECAAFQAPEPMTVTMNGDDGFVVMTSEEYDRLQKWAETARLYKALLGSEVQLQKGKVILLDDALIDKIVSDALGAREIDAGEGLLEDLGEVD